MGGLKTLLTARNSFMGAVLLFTVSNLNAQHLLHRAHFTERIVWHMSRQCSSQARAEHARAPRTGGSLEPSMLEPRSMPGSCPTLGTDSEDNDNTRIENISLLNFNEIYGRQEDQIYIF